MAEVTGEGCYASLRFESGVHRVQRVPTNDVRIHTSTASVVVFPSAADDDTDESMDFDASDLRIDTFRASGAGGQHVNTTNSAVRAERVDADVVLVQRELDLVDTGEDDDGRRRRVDADVVRRHALDAVDAALEA